MMGANGESTMISRFQWLLWLAFFGLFLSGWYFQPNDAYGLYPVVDGQWMQWNKTFISHWGNFLDLSPYNPFSGLGSVFTPNLPWLNPGALVLGLEGARKPIYLLSYTIYFFEIVASIFLLLRAFGFSSVRSMIAAQIHVFVLFPPFTGIFGAYNWYSLAPFYAHLMAMANVMIVCFILAGRFRLAGNLLCLAGFTAAAWIGFFSGPITFLTYGPFYGTLALVVLFLEFGEGRRLFWRMAAVFLVLLSAWTLGVFDYYVGTAATSARTPPGFSLAAWRWDRFTELLDHVWDKNLCFRQGEALCTQINLFYIQIGALLGALAQMFQKDRMRRAMGLFFIGFFVFVYLDWILNAMGTLGWFSVISTGFLTWSMYSFLAVFMMLFLFAPFDVLRAGSDPEYKGLRVMPRSMAFRCREKLSGLGRLFPFLSDTPKRRALLLSLVPVVVFGWLTTMHGGSALSLLGRLAEGDFTGTLPDHSRAGPIINHLAQSIELRRDSPFRGYAVSSFGNRNGPLRQVTGYGGEKPGSSELYTKVLGYLRRQYGTGFMRADLWEHKIPTYEEYGQWVSRQLVYFTLNALGESGDRMQPSILLTYKRDADILRALGVRYVITDLPIDDPGAVLIKTERKGDAVPIYLYELNGANLLTYSPTRMVVATSGEAIMKEVVERKARLRDEAVISRPLDGDFVPSRPGALRPEKDGFRVTAKSDGKSALLLPIQFSNCLEIVDHGKGDPDARLVDANLIQTLLVFEKEADIRVRFEFGLGKKAECRMQDGTDLRRLGLIRIERGADVRE